jgi:HEAT repeat protein
MSQPPLNPLLAVFLAGASLHVACAQNPTPLLTQSADQLLAVLQSQAGHKEKADACRQLSVIGAKEAVPALVALLAEEKLNHMARYALETIPDPGVNSALREALSRLKGRPLVGVIGSLGVRRDPQAVPPLADLLKDADPDTAQAAARALGKIGTLDAAKAIQEALPTVAAANQLAFCEGLFRCAEALAAAGRRSDAQAVYDRLRTVREPHQVRAGALRGAILMRGQAGLPLLLEGLRSDDFVLVAAAARTALEMSGPQVSRVLADELSQLPTDKQVLVIQTLAKRAEAAALPALFAATKSGAQPVRLEAIRSLPQVGDPSAAPVLVGLLNDGDKEIARTALEGLAGLRGQEADAAVVALLTSSQSHQRLTAIDLIGRRRMSAHLPALLKAAGDADAQVRPAALKRLGELGGAAELPALIDLLKKATVPADLEAAEQALGALCARQGQPEASADQLIAPLGGAQPSQKAGLLRVLTTVGGTKALKAVRAAVDDPNAEVHSAAIRALATWKSPDAAPELLALAKSASTPTDKTLCLRSFLDWASHPDLPADQRFAICQQAGTLVQQAEEKRLLLGALGGIPTLESLALAAPYLDDAATGREASAATVAIADKLLKGSSGAQSAPKLIEPLQKASQVAGSADLARKAKNLLEQAQSQAGGK